MTHASDVTRNTFTTNIDLIVSMSLERIQYSAQYTIIFTPCACTRDKVINFVRPSICLFASVSTKIARSKDLGITVIIKCDQIVGSGEILSSLCFLTLGTCHEHCKSCDFIGHAYRPHLAIPCADSTMHVRALCR